MGLIELSHAYGGQIPKLGLGRDVQAHFLVEKPIPCRVLGANDDEFRPTKRSPYTFARQTSRRNTLGIATATASQRFTTAEDDGTYLTRVTDFGLHVNAAGTQPQVDFGPMMAQ